MAESIVVPDLWTGHCQCGDHAYEASGIPNDPHLCSCEHCTRLSGAPAMAWVGFHRDALKWTGPAGEPTYFSTWPTLHRGSCQRCRTQLTSVADGSDMIMVAIFSLSRSAELAPVGHSYRAEAAPWMAITLAPDPQRRT
ncbi:GFA family protein [Streptomyces sp. NBC_00846]|uniref:GFA family protein n=1 Tax=Streptomyces sp. NBC_00846 TaxID=2975849 RepID=UPI00386BA216|nr:GFA family protein [Streptomyces sp. NBC_00846]